MTLINPISQAALPLSGSSAKSPAKNLQKLSELTRARQNVTSELPSDRQNVPVDTQKNGASPLTSEKLQKTVRQLNKVAKNQKRNLHFSMDQELDRMVVTVINTETQEVVRQIPPQEVLALARHFEREMNAILDVMA